MPCSSRFIDDPGLSPAARDARRQVHRLRGFHQHLTVFLLVNSGLAAIDLLINPGRLWFYWPLTGWGIWLLLHAVGTFSRDRWLGCEWEEAKLRELMAAQGKGAGAGPEMRLPGR